MPNRLNAGDSGSKLASYSANATVTQPITSLPATAIEKGQLSAVVKGNTVVNQLNDNVAGCEATTGWNLYRLTLATDNNNELEGTNCLKLTKDSTGANGITYYDIKALLNTSKYYLLSAYVKNYNMSTGIKFEVECVGDVGIKSGGDYSLATTYVRQGVILEPSDFNNAIDVYIRARIEGALSQYAYIDAIMMQEITPAEYALGASALLTKYNYHRGVESSDNVVVTSVGKNLFNKDTVIRESYIPRGTGVVSALAGYCASDFIRVKPSTTYVGITGVANQGAYYDINKAYLAGIPATNANLTTPLNCHYVRFTIANANLNTTQLELGSTATTYEAYTETKVTLPVTELKGISNTIQDTFDCNSGTHVKNCSDWVTLSGNAFTWAFGVDASGFKLITATLAQFSNNIPSSVSIIAVKYNNKKLISVTGADSSDQIYNGLSSVAITISDTDTGWETWVSGTSFTGMTWANLIKCFMNGWKLTTANANVASCVWTGIASGTVKNAGAADYAYCQANIDVGFTPYTMIYQLATPTVTQYSPNILQSNVSGTVIVDSTATIPSLTYSYPTTVKGEIDDAIKMIDKIDEKVDAKFLPKTGEKIKFTPEGGFAIKLTNKTGAVSVKGTVVTVYDAGAIDNAVSKIVVDVPNPIGVIYENGIADGAEVWVVVSGIAEVYFIGNATRGHLARGFLTADGASYVTGQALSEAIPSSPFDVDKHFYEIGHVLQSRVGAGLAKVVLHFN